MRAGLSLNSIQGKWITYPQGSNPSDLVHSLKNTPVGWSAKGEDYAERQLSQGDIHIYYTLNEQGEYRVPRIKINMRGEDVGAVYGAEQSDHLDREIAKVDVIEKKLQELGNKNSRFNERVTETRLLLEIERKSEALEELTNQEIRFLYEFDKKIEQVGLNRDPRIDAIILQRDVHKDLARIYSCRPDQISVNTQEALKKGNKILYHHGDLNLLDISIISDLSSQTLPNYINGDLLIYSGSYESIEGLSLPEVIMGKLSFAFV